MYTSHPYDFIAGSYASLTQFVYVPVDEMLHVLRPLRAGQLRGEPQMTPVLALLYELIVVQDRKIA
jgi:capsid protein